MSSIPISRPRNDFAVVSRPGPRTRDALVAVAARMALADGRVEPAEHRGLLKFLKQNNMLLVLGRADITERFSNEIDRAGTVASAGHGDLLDQLRPLAGLQAACLIATAAAQVAAADGVVHPAETALLRSLHEALGLAPAGTAA